MLSHVRALKGPLNFNLNLTHALVGFYIPFSLKFFFSLFLKTVFHSFQGGQIVRATSHRSEPEQFPPSYPQARPYRVCLIL